MIMCVINIIICDRREPGDRRCCNNNNNNIILLLLYDEMDRADNPNRIIY